MNYHKKQLSLSGSYLPVILEKKTTKRTSNILDPFSKSPEIQKLETFLLETYTKKQKLSQKFYLFKPLH